MICPSCKAEVAPQDFEEVELYCEEQCDHRGYECPKCGKDFDEIWDSIEFDSIAKARGDNV